MEQTEYRQKYARLFVTSFVQPMANAHNVNCEFIKMKSVSIFVRLRDSKQRFSYHMTNKVQASDISP